MFGYGLIWRMSEKSEHIEPWILTVFEIKEKRTCKLLRFPSYQNLKKQLFI